MKPVQYTSEYQEIARRHQLRSNITYAINALLVIGVLAVGSFAMGHVGLSWATASFVENPY